MKRGTREYKPVDDRDRHTGINATRKSFQHPARLRTVNVKLVVNTRITGRYYDRMLVNYKSDMTNETFVQNSVDSFAIKVTAFRETFKFGAIR